MTNIFSKKIASSKDLSDNKNTDTSSKDNNKEPVAAEGKVAKNVEFTNNQVESYESSNLAAAATALSNEAQGLAVDAARSYMNNIMQISLAAQGVIAEKILSTPETASEYAQPLKMLQDMISESVKEFGNIKST